jgi:DNA-binding response OmpR family regulator
MSQLMVTDISNATIRILRSSAVRTEARTMRRVLLIEDDRIISMALRGYLEEAGFDVESAYSGTEALAAIARMPPAIVVTDIDLGPGPDGFAVAHRARAIWPDVRVVFVSGRFSLYAPSPKAAGFVFIAKPYRFEAVLDAVCDAPLPLAA